KVYAVALALVILAAPAMAQSDPGDLTSPYSQDLDVNITVEQIAEFYHAGNADSLDLSVLNAGDTFGKTLGVTMAGNCNFNVDLAVQEINNNIQDDVRFELVTNVDTAAWQTEASDADGDGLWQYRNPAGNLAGFQKPDDSHSWQLGSGSGAFEALPTSIARTEIWSYTDGAERTYTTIDNLFTVYAGYAMPAQGEGDVLVEFYLSPAE
ncbi:MAG: hypothetical protein R6V07_13895, partial [Armatimonadota bacterium]